MKGRVTSCPSCGAPVEFRNRGTYVSICEFCNSAIGRGDKNPEDHGKVADLVPNSSEVRRGTRGQYHDARFEVTGHVQYRHPAGGVWDEWYLAFGTRYGWLSYAQGKYFISYSRPIKKEAAPNFEAVEVGAKFSLRDSVYTVTEKGVATVLGAEGEIPWGFRPNAEHRFADLQGPNGAGATFEFSKSGTQLFIGEEIPLSELKLQHDLQMPGANDVRVTSVSLNCPKCAGQIDLRAPDKTERVICSNCGALLDANQGKLAFLKTLEQKEIHPHIPLGSTGTIQGRQFTVIGFMERYTSYQGRIYPWTEYLLFDAESGFHWLIHSERHWTFASDVSAGEVSLETDRVEFDNRRYRIYDRGQAIVRYVLGEFYWKVETGQTATTADYICPPHGLSVERSWTPDGDEMNLTHSTYLSCEEVEAAFDLESGSLPRPWGIAPSQPAPETGWGVFLLWPVFLVALMVLKSMFSKADGFFMVIAMLFVSLFPVGVIIYKHNFEVQRWRDSDYSPYASDD